MASNSAAGWDDLLAEATTRAAASLKRDEVLNIGERRDLQPLVRTELAHVCDQYSAATYVVDSTEKTLPLPNWKPRPGGLDVGVRTVSDNALLCAIELKLRELNWTLW